MIKRMFLSPDSKSGGFESRLIFVAVCVIIAAVLSLLMISAMVFFAHIAGLRDSQRDNTFLRELSGMWQPRAENEETRQLSVFDMELRQINPDYIAWITIEGTAVDYPVVRGSDNIQYLDTSFFGDFNVFGTLFMDYRNVGEFVPHIIIYGHNSRYGNKFSDLHNFLDERFLTMHNTITLTVNDRVVEYEIFSVRLTDIHDPAYFLDFSVYGSFFAFAERNGAPAGTEQIITLSTCVTRGDDDERLVVQGFLRQ